MRDQRRVYVPHCVWCGRTELEADLAPYVNSFTKAVTLWCVDVDGCRARKGAK